MSLSNAQSWLPSPPERWSIRPGMSVLSEKKIKNHDLREKQLLSLSYGRIIKKSSDSGGLKPESFTTYQIVDPGDIIVRGTDLQNDKVSHRIGQVKDRGMITSAYICVTPRADISADFAYRILDFYDRTKQIYRYGSGLRQNLSWDDFKRMPILLPPVDEQAAIVKYLYHATARLDKAIAAKRHVVKLLDEQKQVIIHRAVTRGLDKNARLKDSGVPWFGKVPSHWKVIRLKAITKNLNPIRIPLSASVRGSMTKKRYPYYGASGVIDKVDKYLFDEETILVAEDGANLVLRNLPLVLKATGKYWVNNHAHILRLEKGEIDFYVALMETMDFRPWITGAAQPKLTKDRFMAMEILWPPLEEQSDIVDSIEKNTKPISLATEKIKKEIALLEEFRTALISEVVTGKRDVRALAAALPDIQSQDEILFDDGDGLGDDLMEEALA